MPLREPTQACVLDAVLRAQGILMQYIEPGPHDCAQTLSRLFVIFDDDELTSAINVLNLEATGAAMSEVDDAPNAPLRNTTLEHAGTIVRQRYGVKE